MEILLEKDGLRYELLEARNTGDVADVVARSFTDGSEPVGRSLGLAAEDFKQLVEALMPKYLLDGLSIVVRDAKTGDIAAALLNDELGGGLPVDPSRFEWAAPLFALAMDMYGRYFQGQHPEPGRIVHFVMLAVSGSCRGKGVANQLIELSLERARGRGYDRVVVEATGLISQHLMRKAGFITRVEIPYATFEYAGKRPFANTGDHPSIMLMDKELL